MPKWGIEMVEGIVAEWHVEQGASFSKGDLLVGIETDKIVNEVEAEYDAVCLARLVEEGDTMAVGELLAVFGDAGTTADEVNAFVRDFVPAGGAAPDAATQDSAPAEPAAAPPPEPEPTPATTIPDGVSISAQAHDALAQSAVLLDDVHGSGRNGRIQLQDVQRAALPPVPPAEPISNAVNLSDYADVHATDIAKRVAQSNAINLRQVSGSGRDGRIRLSDLGNLGEPALPQTPIAPEQNPVNHGQPVPFTNMRKQIARRLTTSYQNIPHYYLQSDVFVDQLVEARAAFNADLAVKTSLNDWLVRAVALTLAEHPAVNIHVGDETITAFAEANVAIAVAIDGGLITPVVKNAQALSVAELNQQIAALATRARDGALSNADVSGGTFTISNLGMFGVSRFTALINPPQGAILSVGAARPVPTERDGNIVFASQMAITLGCDHRAIDGATGGAFLKDLARRLENPDELI